MEDLFKFLPIALWVLYKAFGSSKSNKQNPNRKPKPVKKSNNPNAGKSLEDILKELSGEKKVEKPKALFSKPERENHNQRIEIEDHQYDFRPEYEHHADTGPSLEEIRSEIDSAKGLEEDEELDLANFKLQQAIIYNTILNRPEY